MARGVVAVLGATGATGRQLVLLCLQAGFTVYAVARRPDAVLDSLPGGPGALEPGDISRLVIMKGLRGEGAASDAHFLFLGPD